MADIKILQTAMVIFISQEEVMRPKLYVGNLKCRMYLLWVQALNP